MSARQKFLIIAIGADEVAVTTMKSSAKNVPMKNGRITRKELTGWKTL